MALNCKLLVLLVFALLAAYSRATIEPHRDHLYKHEHFTDSKEHDVRYDHDAFLGPDAQKFEEFPPEESKKKLKVIVLMKIDKNQDGKVSLEELEDWIERQRKSFMYENVQKNIINEDKDGDRKISWEEYKQAHFGQWDNDNLPNDHSLRRQMQKAQHKFNLADENKDGKMNSDEYVNFEHPEENENMEELAIDEIIEDVDQDGDGFITVTEFIGHYGDAEKAPGWVEREREEFARQFDKNKDGKLNREEVRDWALPQRGESLDEAKHLIDGSDDDADGSLSIEEIMVHWELFVGSKATDHGETLRKMDRQEL